MRPRLNTRGTALIETLSVMSILPMLMSAALTACYVSFARVWIDRETYEAVVCLGSLAHTGDCEKGLRTGITRALPFGRLSRVRLSRDSKSASVQASFELLSRPVADVRTTRSLPLSVGGSR